MRTLVYLSDGQGGHIRETIFSILSALDRAGPAPRGFEIVVYTDDDRPFRGLPVKFEILGEERARDWIGPHGYKHRRKIMTVVDALDRYRGRVAFIDSDTWFKRSPVALFDRIAAGRPCLHLREGRLASVRDGHGSILPTRQDPERVLQDARRVYTHRPRPRLRRRCKLAVVHRFQDAGFLQHRMRASG